MMNKNEIIIKVIDFILLCLEGAFISVTTVHLYNIMHIDITGSIDAISAIKILIISIWTGVVARYWVANRRN